MYRVQRVTAPFPAFRPVPKPAGLFEDNPSFLDVMYAWYKLVILFPWDHSSVCFKWITCRLRIWQQRVVVSLKKKFGGLILSKKIVLLKTEKPSLNFTTYSSFVKTLQFLRAHAGDGYRVAWYTPCKSAISQTRCLQFRIKVITCIYE